MEEYIHWNEQLIEKCLYPIGALPSPVTPWGKPALGYKTRKKNKASNKLIVSRRTK